ncbi:cell division control protein 25 [Ceratobasidium sp. AG-Ba]|nr:cell division control protein 25 [Ceratobasidium sp. AG-Ba]QRW06580.1 cell division control protein 25 [Ceratobasidium sp. AG-Ba]
MATEQEEPSSFWVRAMYDYHSTDDSSLSFSRGDIVEVLTQLESGWWDGLIGNERGWFPSNFVTIISEAEAEAEIALRAEPAAAVVEVDPTQLDASGSDSEWLQDQIEEAAGDEFDLAEFVPRVANPATNNADIWIPQVEPNGQIVYVNGLGQRRNELPVAEGLDDIAVPEFAPPSPQPSPRAPPPPVVRQRANTATTASSLGGFAFVARSTTPEPWLKRLTDNGQAFYYENRHTGEISWSRPEPGDRIRGPSAQQSLSSSASGLDLRGRFRSAAPYDEIAADADIEPEYDESDGRDSDPLLDRTLHVNNRESVYSDASEVNPLGRESPFVRSATVQDVRPIDTEPRTDPAEVQRRLAPSPPETIEELSAAAKEAIGAVSRSMEEKPVPRVGLVAQVIVAVRNLLYVSGTLAPTPTALYPLIPGDGPNENSPPVVSADLKQFQRKVTATLSKLVLSARAADSTGDEGEDESGAHQRVAIDAGELERAVVRFVVEVRRASEEGAERRLRGVLGTSNIGRAAAGAGVGGEWRGAGFIPDVSVGKALNLDVCEELRGLLAEVERGLVQIEYGVAQMEQQEEGVSTITSRGRAVIAGLCALLSAAEDVDVASKVGSDIEIRRGMAVKRVGSRDELGRSGAVRRMGSRDELKRMGSRDGLRAMSSRDELRRVGSRDELRRMGSRDQLRRMGSHDALSRTASSEVLSRPGSKSGLNRSPGFNNSVPLPSATPKSLDTSADVRRAVRRLEVVKQALYDAGVTLLLASQTVHVAILKSAGAAPEPLLEDDETKKGSDGESAVSLVLASVGAVRRNGREMLALYDSIARTEPPEAYVPSAGAQPDPRGTRFRADTNRSNDPYSRTDNLTRTGHYSQAHDYSRNENYARASDNQTLSRTESYDGLRTDPSLMSPVDEHLAMMFGEPQFGVGDDRRRELVNGGRSRAGSIGRERLESVGRDVRLDSTGSGRGMYSRAYPERGVQSKPRVPMKQQVDSAVSLPQSDVSQESLSNGQHQRTGTTVGQPQDEFDNDDEEFKISGEFETGARPRPTNKLKRLLGDEAPAGDQPIIPEPIVDSTPWYLKPTYSDPKQILTNTDGGVRGGTLPALVERLTMHDQLDSSFIDSFLMTYKSFTTMQELFRLLVERFRIAPPEGLKPDELQEWTEKKQTPVRVRVVNIFRKMLMDPSVIDKEDTPILGQIKGFAMEIIRDVPPAKQLIVLVDRFMSGEIASRKLTVTTREPPPPSLLPRSGKRLKLLDIDSTELARQLTILESRQYNAIKPIECLARARDEPAENDSIKTIITTTNKIAGWVAYSVLDKEDARRRAAIIKQFINVAERCRNLHNYSTMAALIAGLNSTPIRRLKRTWEQVPQRWVLMLDDVESTLDSGKNFTGYKQRLKTVDAPCVPFLGVYLTVLTFIQDGNKDFISKEDSIINFGKRQKTAEVIREIQGYQAKQYNLTPVDLIQTFIEQSLATIDEKADYWDRSLEVEPREREDEKMTRMLQESGFL